MPGHYGGSSKSKGSDHSHSRFDNSYYGGTTKSKTTTGGGADDKKVRYQTSSTGKTNAGV